MEADERKRKSGTDPGGEIQKGSTCGTAVGAKQGRTKGNEQRTEYANLKGSGRETSRGRRGEAKGT